MNAHTRIQWLHKKMTMKSYPNAQRLAERFQCSAENRRIVLVAWHHIRGHLFDILCHLNKVACKTGYFIVNLLTRLIGITVGTI